MNGTDFARNEIVGDDLEQSYGNPMNDFMGISWVDISLIMLLVSLAAVLTVQSLIYLSRRDAQEVLRNRQPELHHPLIVKRAREIEAMRGGGYGSAGYEAAACASREMPYLLALSRERYWYDPEFVVGGNPLHQLLQTRSLRLAKCGL